MDTKNGGKSKIDSNHGVLLLLRIVIFFAVVGLIIVGLLLLRSSSDDDGNVSVEDQEGICSNELLSRAAITIDPIVLEELGPIVDEVEQIENYDQDENCLYLTTWYHMNNANLDQAEIDFAKLEKLYDPEIDYNPILFTEGIALRPDNLRGTLDFLKEEEVNIREQYEQFNNFGTQVAEPDADFQ